MRIYQIVPSLYIGDAIGNHVMILDRKMNEAGIHSRIYSLIIGDNVKNKNVFKYKKLPKLKNDDLLIYHMCKSSIISEDIKKMNCKKITIYHNTTPVQFFSQYMPELCKYITESILEIQNLNSSFDWCIAVSEFNKQDLIKMGYDSNKISVIPILLDFDDYKKEPDNNILKKYNDGYTNILFVGRIAPNKKQEDIIRAFAYYKKYINNKSRLILVGSPMGDRYINKLKLYVKALKISDVIFTEKIPFDQILAFYSIADIFLCMSEHEGFCVPLLEAMIFNVPIVAYNSTAIPYTLNGKGILIDDKDPILVSKIIEKILNDKELKQNIIEEQNERLNDFEHNKIFNNIIKVINNVCDM